MAELRYNNIRKLDGEKIFKNWLKIAEPVLTDIISKNKEKIIGLEFESDQAGGSVAAGCGVNINKIILDEKGNYVIEERDRDYGGSRIKKSPFDFDKMDERYNPIILAKEILENLNGISPHIWGFNYYHNRKRNKFINNLEKRTGRNLKKEVIEIYKRSN